MAHKYLWTIPLGVTKDNFCAQNIKGEKKQDIEKRYFVLINHIHHEVIQEEATLHYVATMRFDYKAMGPWQCLCKAYLAANIASKGTISTWNRALTFMLRPDE